MTILALDPGLVTGWALLELDGGRLALNANALMPCGILVPATAGMTGQRQLLNRWLDRTAERVDEIAIEGEIATAAVPSRLEAVRVRETIDACLERLGRKPALYAPSTVKAVAKRLSNSEQKGLPTKALLREMARDLLGVTWPVGPDHVSDALAVGICHAHSVQGWRPDGYRCPPAQSRVGDTFMARIRRAREDATR